MRCRKVYFTIIASTLALLLSGFACSRRGKPSTIVRQNLVPSPIPAASPTRYDTVDHFINNGFDPLYDWERRALNRVWKQVPHHESYELVQSVYGEVAGAYGLALIVMDKSLSGSKRSSLIVFIQHPHDKFDSYWIFKNEDLSRVTISRLSGDIMVNGLRQDGSSLNCEIAWSRKDNKWTCIGF